jgi:hypothetical protein
MFLCLCLNNVKVLIHVTLAIRASSRYQGTLAKVYAKDSKHPKIPSFYLCFHKAQPIDDAFSSGCHLQLKFLCDHASSPR